jgi:transposase
MFTLSSGQRYFWCTGAVDMRKSFNGLCGLVRSRLGSDPLSGDVFIFVNRRRDRIKLLVWDRTGFVLYYKLLEKGTFELPGYDPQRQSYQVSWQELVLIMEGVSLQSVRQRKRYRRA